MHVDDSFIDQLMDWAAGTAGAQPGDPLATPQEIMDYIDTQWQSIGDFHTDASTLPVEAEERGGTFSNPYDMAQHWLSSGLIGFDDQHNMVPSPLLHILVELDEAGDPYYSVWVGPSNG